MARQLQCVGAVIRHVKRETNHEHVLRFPFFSMISTAVNIFEICQSNHSMIAPKYLIRT